MELSLAIVLFLLSTGVVAFFGVKLTKTADQLADITGLGEALFGAVIVGGVTSLPGIITSVVAALNGYPELAVSNAIGGIAAQTIFLSVADISYKKKNLEHAAASFPNLMHALLLIGMLSLVIVGAAGPDVSVLNIHPFSFILIAVYFLGTRLVSSAKDKPMWKPRMTKATVADVPSEEFKKLNLKTVAFKFIFFALIVGVAGYTIGQSGMVIADKTQLSESLVGMLFTAIATSLPELIVSISAVRRGALTLAISNIIGGNSFDVLFIAFADMAFTGGSILHAITQNQVYLMAMTILMVSVLTLGLLHREEEGFGKIGWESVTIILVYILGSAFIFW